MFDLGEKVFLSFLGMRALMGSACLVWPSDAQRTSHQEECSSNTLPLFISLTIFVNFLCAA